MKVYKLNDSSIQKFDPELFFKDTLTCDDKEFNYIFPMVGQEAEQVLQLVGYSLLQPDYIKNFIKRYLAKQLEDPPFKFIDKNIILKNEEKKEDIADEREGTFAAKGKTPLRDRPNSASSLSRHSAPSSSDNVNFTLKQGHIKQIFTL